MKYKIFRFILAAVTFISLTACGGGGGGSTANGSVTPNNVIPDGGNVNLPQTVQNN